MTFDEEFEKEVEEIIGRLQCPKDFKCYRSGFEDLGMEGYLECLEVPPDCTFAFEFGDSHFCKWPLRVFITKKLKK